MSLKAFLRAVIDGVGLVIFIAIALFIILSIHSHFGVASS